MAEIPDAELEQLRQQSQRVQELEQALQQATSAGQETAQLRGQLTQLQQQYQNDVQRIQAFYAQQLQQQAPQQEEEEEEPEQKRLREIVQKGLQQAQQQQMQPFMEQTYRNQRYANKELARQKFPDFARWEAEIEAALNQYPLQIAAQPEAYESAYKAVRANHLDELLQEQLEAARQARHTPTEGEESEEEEEVTAPPPLPTRTTPRPSVGPSRIVAAPTRTSTPKQKGAFERLPSGDREFIQELGVEAEDFNKFSDPNYTPDIFGFNDPKTGKRRHLV